MILNTGTGIPVPVPVPVPSPKIPVPESQNSNRYRYRYRYHGTGITLARCTVQRWFYQDPKSIVLVTTKLVLFILIFCTNREQNFTCMVIASLSLSYGYSRLNIINVNHHYQMACTYTLDFVMGIISKIEKKFETIFKLSVM